MGGGFAHVEGGAGSESDPFAELTTAQLYLTDSGSSAVTNTQTQTRDYTHTYRP